MTSFYHQQKRSTSLQSAIVKGEAQAEYPISVSLNSFGRFAVWITASIIPLPSVVSAR